MEFSTKTTIPKMICNENSSLAFMESPLLKTQIP